MDGLIVRSPYVEEILDGSKTWEIRGNRTTKRGRIALIRGGSGLIVGTAELVDALGPLELGEMLANCREHRIPRGDLEAYGLHYSKTYAWVLQNAKALRRPIPYTHPPGAVIWVKVPEVRS